MAEKGTQTAKAEGNEVEVLRDMAIRTISVTKPQECVKAGKTLELGTIYGLVTAIKTREDKSGRLYSYLVGDFGATNTDGKEFISEKLFLPPFVMEPLEGLFAKDGATKFAYTFYAQPDDSISMGWKYAAKSLIKAQANNVLSELKAQIKSGAKAA